MLHPLTTGSRIGEGAYGKVKEVLDVTSLQRYAVKIMKVSPSCLAATHHTLLVPAHQTHHWRSRPREERDYVAESELFHALPACSDSHESRG